MSGLQDGECPTKFVLKQSVDGFESYYACDFCYGIFLGNKYFVRSFLDDFDDILASMLLEREDVWCQKRQD
jgi:hypothetical protein